MTDTILFGLFSSSILNVIQVLIVLVPILSVASNLFAGVKDEFQLYEMVFQWVSVANVAQIALVIVLVLVVNFVYVVFISLLRYYPFQVQFSENEINIEYGTISKKSYTFNRKKISGIKRKQTILMRMFGYETLELLVVGYGDQSQEDKVQEVPLLIPIIKVKKGDKILTQLFKDYEEEKEIFDADKRGFPYFFLTFRMFFGVALMGSSLFVSQLSNVRILSLLLLGIIVLSVWMEYKSTKIFMGDRYITVVSGSFKLEKKVLPWNKIESLAGVGSVWKQKRGLVTILFSANAPLTESKLTSKNMDKNTLEKIIERIPI